MVPRALLVRGCSCLAGWPDLRRGGTARGAHATLIRELGAVPVDYQREDFTRVVPGGFGVIFDGVAEEGYRRSIPGGLLCAYGHSGACRRSVAWRSC